MTNRELAILVTEKQKLEWEQRKQKVDHGARIAELKALIQKHM